LTVDLVTIHHEGAGVPTNYPRGADGGYSIWIGTTNWTILRAPDISYATLGFNHVSLDVCLSGNREVVPVSSGDLILVRKAVADARNRGWVTDHPDVEPHRASFSTACPGSQTMAKWSQVVAACHTPVVAPTPNIDKVRPMYNPPLVIVGGIAASCNAPSGPHGATWIVGAEGHVYALNGAPYLGGPYGHPYWGDRRAAQIKAKNYGNAIRKRWGYKVTATTGEQYDFKP
jgi:hypothetical protein